MPMKVNYTYPNLVQDFSTTSIRVANEKGEEDGLPKVYFTIGNKQSIGNYTDLLNPPDI